MCTKNNPKERYVNGTMKNGTDGNPIYVMEHVFHFTNFLKFCDIRHFYFY